jgi:hypothetical protein
MYEELSVEENIFFSCLLFSRKDAWGGRRGLVESRLLVNDVLSILGLQKIRNSIIGNSEVRGVSGKPQTGSGEIKSDHRGTAVQDGNTLYGCNVVRGL